MDHPSHDPSSIIHECRSWKVVGAIQRRISFCQNLEGFYTTLRLSIHITPTQPHQPIHTNSIIPTHSYQLNHTNSFIPTQSYQLIHTNSFIPTHSEHLFRSTLHTNSPHQFNHQLAHKPHLLSTFHPLANITRSSIWVWLEPSNFGPGNVCGFRGLHYVPVNIQPTNLPTSFKSSRTELTKKIR